MSNEAPRANRGRLLVSCPDGPGIVARVSRLLFDAGANVVDSAQHATAPVKGDFFMRVEFDLDGLEARLPELEAAFRAEARPMQMQFRFERAARLKRMAIFVSRFDHCLLELLWQWKAGDLRGSLACVVSNHDDLRQVVEAYGVPFHHVPVAAEGKAAAEQEALRRLGPDIDLVVLARYMQILSADFVSHFPARIINIHHSFLPAFIGANPYAQALERGVKLIGATAHYVTPDLDAGPIIEQDVHRVGHRDGVEDLKRIGRQVERAVLARAVAWHLDDRVWVQRNKTLVFS